MAAPASLSLSTIARRNISNECGSSHVWQSIVESEQDACAALYDLYQFLVRNWIANRLAGGVSADVCEALTNDAFVKFFRAVDAKRFEGFDSILGLLAYLRTCARSVAADYRRSRRTLQPEEP